jgi:hypothetical protein
MNTTAAPPHPPKPEKDRWFNKHEKRILLITVVVLFGVVFVLLGIILKSVHAATALIEAKYGLMEEQVQSAFAAQERHISAERAILSRELAESTDRLEETMVTGSNRTNRNIAATNQLVGQVEQVYADLLAEQQKKTLESLYGEGALIKAWEDAQGLFKEGKYKQANELFILLTEEQPENQEAWFYRYYSLFLVNRNDREQYRAIRERFMLLERGGYTRSEMGEVLNYIAAEERGTVPFGE